ncbi:protein-L-isoaspartate(D-aspartate) O-methyltransferase [Natronorarus salvus]|uniref:protein-L-isoaspartate(D-aspartate) O-methyltransferase n=1 Tax=Natronorarus salvus TaxID=3117733 RepID=UPI002F260DB2
MSTDDRSAERDRMVDGLRSRGLIERESTDRALRTVPRHAFVPVSREGEAYADRPLPIGDGQTVSAPHMVAKMLDLLDLDRGERVLEVGTGCGYHAAVTAEVVGPENLSSVEYSADLAEGAHGTLADIGYGDVSIRVGDGREGWPEHAPFDAIYLTCAAPTLPDALVDQLRGEGPIVAPIGTRSQTLYRFWRREDGSLDRENHGGVRFVRMR